MRLFTYCLPVDDGAAPNPFWGACLPTMVVKFEYFKELID